VKALRRVSQIIGEGRVRAAVHRRLRWVRLIVGERAHGQLFFSQFGEDAFLQRYYASKAHERTGDATQLQTGFYVDVGAYAPKQFSNTYWFYKQGWRGITIDPTPGTAAEFDRQRPRDKNLELAISDTSGTLIFYHFGSPHVINTLSKVEADEWAQRMKQAPVEIVVHAVRLEQVLEEHLPAGQQIDFLSIDAEEWDYQVLKSNDWNRFRPELVVIEEHDFAIRFQEKSAILALLRQAGYEICAWIPPSLVFKRCD
jgi:FkbM family methyltransferase